MYFDKSRCRILICDGSRTHIARLVVLLHKDGYSDVTQAHFDLVMFDAGMPGSALDDHRRALQEQRTHTQHRHAP